MMIKVNKDCGREKLSDQLGDVVHKMMMNKYTAQRYSKTFHTLSVHLI